ncbi:MAG: hypothetical protein PHX81_12000 [Eubacteriales bacterium]|nr:hypothetical protein [Clostridiales bacterium]MDD4140939.1 hypothetical protein [Eubacteriales bacterium]
MSLSDDVHEYTAQLKKGQIQKAYKGIMTFMSGLRTVMVNKHPDDAASGLYAGTMDMTYFALTPLSLKKRNLKIAVVYLHERNRFDVWLAGGNRKIQAETIERLRHTNTGGYKLSWAEPGVDSIVEHQIVEQPNFDHAEDLMAIIEQKTRAFTRDILALIGEP